MSRKDSNSTAPRGTLISYASGFILSILLTLAAYIPVSRHVDTHHLSYAHSQLVFLILFFAVVQLVVQVLFFLHLSQESKPRWNLISFLFMLMVVLIIVIGSIWIMYHLNYNMTPEEESNQLLHDEGIR